MECFSTIYDPVEHDVLRSIYIKTQVMKTIATLIFVLFIGISAQAQTATEEVNVETIEMAIVTETWFEEIILESTIEVARLYKRTNTRVKKELTFSTKANRAKMA
jgi:hypothetical protein